MTNALPVALPKLLIRLSILVAFCVVSVLTGCQGSAGFVNIWDAIEADDPIRIEKYVKAGGDLNIVGFNGWTPLYQALHDMKGRAYEKLLELGADPNFVMEGGRVVTKIAVGERGVFWLEKALEHGGDPNLLVPNATRRFRGRPLRYAFECLYYDFAKVRLLIEHGADINLREDDGRNYLDFALQRGDYDAVLYLLDRGGQYLRPPEDKTKNTFLERMKNQRRRSYIHEEDWQGILAIRKWLEDHGTHLDYPDD